MASDPKIIHELEQLTAVLRDMAPMLARFRDGLVEEGFSREEAFEMAKALMVEIYRKAGRRKRQ